MRCRLVDHPGDAQAVEEARVRVDQDVPLLLALQRRDVRREVPVGVLVPPSLPSRSSSGV